MPLTGTAKPPRAVPGPARGRAFLSALLEQLDGEWLTLRQDTAIDPDEAALLAYYHVCVRVLLQQVGDPYHTAFPPAYAATERVPKLCAYLIRVAALEGSPLKVERERNLTALRTAWPAYRDLVHPDIPNGVSPLELEVLPFSWAAIESGWSSEDDDPDRTTFLPTFSSRATADFHLAGLATLLLNRQLRYYLTDLGSHPTDAP